MPSEATLKSEELTAADTLLLRQQGVLPDTTVQKADSLLMPAAGESLDGGSWEAVVPDRKSKSSRRKQRKQSPEAVLPKNERRRGRAFVVADKYPRNIILPVE
ncbi:MAG: hypothetical protein ACLR8Y_17605 [Alistipes indistinctus]